jgi:hypothetical protein
VLARGASRTGDTDLQCRVRGERRVQARERRSQRRVDVVRDRAARGGVLVLAAGLVANSA